MIKVADKPSMDPVQQKLRQAKKQWNKDVSAFIDDLIHYKKLVNGQPNKFFKEKSSIKDPIPADPTTILGTLANDFQELSQRGSAIIAAQTEYSKTRRKKQPKKPTQVGPSPSMPITPEAPAAPDLSKQLAAFEVKYGLIAEGSNPVSRFFTKLLNPGFGFGEAARIRKYRMSLLSLCAKMYSDLNKFQVEIVKSSNDSIDKSYNMLNSKIWHNWDLIYKGILTYKSNMPKSVQDAGGPIDSPIEHDKPASAVQPSTQAPVPNATPAYVALVTNIENDYKTNYGSVGVDNMGGADADLEVALLKFKIAPADKKEEASKKVLKEYKTMIDKLNQSLGTNGLSLKEISSQKTKIASVDVMEKLAQDFLWKWLGKARHGLSSSMTSGYRLDLFKNAEEVRTNLDSMMDSLEKGMDLEGLMDLAADVHRQLIAMKGLTRALYAAAPKPKGSKQQSLGNIL
jgi:hypothetical protein